MRLSFGIQTRLELPLHVVTFVGQLLRKPSPHSTTKFLPAGHLGTFVGVYPPLETPSDPWGVNFVPKAENSS
jgi:hypothetical protein